MTHVLVTDNRKNSPTKGRDIMEAVTIIECPPMKIIGARFYAKSKDRYGEQPAAEVHLKGGKHLPKTTKWKTTGSLDKIDAGEYTRAMLLVQTQPELTHIGQKKPQVLEIAFGGSVEDCIAFAKDNQEITAEQVFAAGQFIDSHSVTKGKGTAGPVKRFGVGLRSHKSEKSNRRAVLGPEGYAKVTFRSPQQGKLGYHLRTEHNKQIITIEDAENVQIKGGLVKYGHVKNPVILLKGSVAGPKKRLITLTKATRQDPKASTQAMEVAHIATRSQQGNQ